MIEILNIEYHRNGVSGIGFHVIRFIDESEHGDHVMLATVFPEQGAVAVYDVVKLTAGDIRFGSNSYRGDWYESDLRAAIAKREEQYA